MSKNAKLMRFAHRYYRENFPNDTTVTAINDVIKNSFTEFMNNVMSREDISREEKLAVIRVMMDQIEGYASTLPSVIFEDKYGEEFPKY